MSIKNAKAFYERMTIDEAFQTQYANYRIISTT
ncbi:MAG: Nif11-like leader peptide family natural product precursor [Xenococcaceae cyanobacterium]